jgi:hypothetical protein
MEGSSGFEGNRPYSEGLKLPQRDIADINRMLAGLGTEGEKIIEQTSTEIEQYFRKMVVNTYPERLRPTAPEYRARWVDAELQRLQKKNVESLTPIDLARIIAAERNDITLQKRIAEETRDDENYIRSEAIAQATTYFNQNPDAENITFYRTPDGRVFPASLGQTKYPDASLYKTLYKNKMPIYIGNEFAYEHALRVFDHFADIIKNKVMQGESVATEEGSMGHLLTSGDLYEHVQRWQQIEAQAKDAKDTMKAAEAAKNQQIYLRFIKLATEPTEPKTTKLGKIIQLPFRKRRKDAAPHLNDDEKAA